MLLTIYIIGAIVMVLSGGYYIGFVTAEGKDERGQAILGSSSQIVFSLVALGFVYQLMYIRFANPTLEQIQTSIFIWMIIFWLSNSLSIFVLKRRI